MRRPFFQLARAWRCPGRDATTGFTLVELVAVIVILGVLSAVAIPKYLDYSKKARIAAVCANLKTMYRVQREYELVNGPIAVTSGTTIWIQGEIPSWLDNRFASAQLFADTPPYGGDYFYYTEINQNYSEIGMVMTSVPSDEALAIDATIDDGVLNTGLFRQTTSAGYFYWHWDPTP